VLAFFVVKHVVTPEIQDSSKYHLYDSSDNLVVITPEEINKNVNLLDEVKKPQSHQKVISFFWQNNSNDNTLKWLQYGAPWLVSQDLKRTPVLSVKTPYDSDSILSDLVSKGFTQALDVPLSLALQIANTNSAKWMILGSFEKVGTNIVFTARIIDVITGDEIESISEKNDDLLTSLNGISKRLGSILHEYVPKSKNVIPDMAIQEHTSKNINAIKHLISAKNEVAFNNNYQAGIKNLDNALDEDGKFAEANLLAASYYRAIGDIPQAIEQSKNALMLDYKVYQESVYALKANLFGMTGKASKAMQVLENWVAAFPESAIGLTTLGRNYLVLNKLENAKDVYEKLAVINSNQDDSLLNLGRINRLQDNQEEALKVLQQYLDNNPEKADAYLELADAYKQFMLLDKAKEMYEKASIIGSKNFEAEIGLAFVTAYEGNYVLALDQLHSLLILSENNTQKFKIQESIKKLYVQTGQIQKAFEIHDLQVESGKEMLSPLHYSFTIDGGEIELLILSGEFNKALSHVEKLKSKTKPPFHQIASAFYLMVYEAMETPKNYEKELLDFDGFLKSFPIPYYEQMMFYWKGKLAVWNQEFELADENYNQALEFSKKSFIRLQTLEIVDMISYAKAESFYQQNRMDEAFAELDLILTHNPLFARAHYLKAKCALSQRDVSAAKAEINLAKEIWKLADTNFIGLIDLNQLESEIQES
jgi:tetratricopeptide (TPR) repeat protein